MKPIAFPKNDRFVEDLILQRTGEFVNYGGSAALEQWFANGDRSQLVDCLRQKGLVDSFLSDTADRLRIEAEELSAQLPISSARNAISIGPGNGLIELFLFHRLRPSRLLLIDIEDSALHAHGFARHGSGYASLEATKQFLIANDVPEDRILTCNPKMEPLPTIRFDLLISLLSMGFHYPCDDYADFIVNNIEVEGRVVLDKRNRVQDSGYSRLLGCLRVEAKTSSAKSERVVLVRQT